MKATNFPALLERFFTQRLMTQRQASPHTIASYRDTFRLLLGFVQKQLHKPPSNLNLSDLDAPLIGAFLNDLEKRRGVTTRTRNVRLTAIRSFFRYAAYQEPAQSEHIQRVLAIPKKRQDRPLVGFLTRPEIDTLLSAPGQSTWIGRRDHALLLLTLQTGLRLSEITSLGREDLVFGAGAHVHCEGKGRKDRCTPLTRQTAAVLKAWLKEPIRGDSSVLFPTVHGRRLSPDAVQYLLAKHMAVARQRCPTLKHKRVSPHVLRHYLPFLTMSCTGTRAQYFPGKWATRQRHSMDSSSLCREKGVHREVEHRQPSSFVASAGRPFSGIYRTACKIAA